MKIAFWGSSLISAYWNGAATYYRGLLKALARRGHDITFYEPEAFERQQHADIAPPDWARVVVYDPGDDLGPCLDRSGQADLVVKTSGIGVLDDYLCQTLLRRRRPDQRIVYWDVDAPATLAALEAREEPVLAETLRDFDAVFTYGGGPPVQQAYRQCGARRVCVIYNALDPETHHPVAPEPGYRADVMLLANRLPDREARIRQFFIDVAAANPDRRFQLGGNGWKASDMPANVRLLGHVNPGKHNVLNASSRVVLNVTREAMARMGYSPATRVFEAAGAAACIISDAWAGVETFLEPGSEILLAEDGRDVSGWLSATSAEEAREIGRRARRRVLMEHTYEHRALDVERSVSQINEEDVKQCAS